jgi:predicted short-subunit dehydrogenase-like oxidoreductase (DUF2520 family)
LGRALRQRGYRITTVVGRSLRQARRAVAFIGQGRPHGRLNGAWREAETVLLAVPDSHIRIVAERLAVLSDRRWRGKVVLHTSGSRSFRELAALRRRGAACGSFHPLFPFAEPLPELPAGVFFGVEGDPRAVRRARAWARALHGIVVPVPSNRKVLYHAAAALASGHALTLADLSTRILTHLGVRESRARQALLPLTRATLQQYERLGARAWTGPLARGDLETVRSHLRELKRLPSYVGGVYAALGTAALTLYAKKLRRRTKRERGRKR